MCIKIKKRHCLLVSLLLLASCGEDRRAEEMIQIYDKGVMSEFEEKLISNGVSFRKDSEGSIWYQYKDKRIVSRIESKLLKETLLNKYSVSYRSKDDEKLFTTELKKAGIIFWNRKLMSNNWIFWNEKDNTKVNSINEMLYKKRLERVRVK